MIPRSVVAEPLEAVVRIAVADPVLAEAIERSVAAALHAAMAALPETEMPVVRLRTRKRLARLGAARIAARIAIVRVTRTNARHLAEIVLGLRAAEAAGVVLVWDGVSPARSLVEPRVFGVLEAARATPAGPPVVLCERDEPPPALRVLIATHATRADQAARARKPAEASEGS